MSKFILHLYRALFAHKFFKGLNTKLFQLSLRGLGILNYENDKVSGEEFLIRKILPKILSSDEPVLFDVGANYGNYSTLLLQKFPSATVYAFEPHPKSYEIIKEKVNSDRLRAFNIALGEKSGKLTLYDRADVSGSEHATLHHDVISEIHKQEVVSFEVNVESLDVFTLKEGIANIDFVKIDTEGHELAVLNGAVDLIKRGAIRCIQLEFNEMNIVSRVFFRDIKKALYNYKLYRLLPNSLLPVGNTPLETELFAYQNIVAIPKHINI